MMGYKWVKETEKREPHEGITCAQTTRLKRCKTFIEQPGRHALLDRTSGTWGEGESSPEGAGLR